MKQFGRNVLQSLILVLAVTQQGAPLADDAVFDGGLDEESLLFMDVPSVFSASKYEQKVTEAPARISIVTADEIQRYGHRSLVDVINTLPGFHTTYDRAYSYAGNRGFGVPGDFNTRILLLVDGHRVNENIFDGVIIDRGAVVDIDLVERVEVVRGPASSLYGSSAFFGVINVIMKKGRDLQGAELSASGGSFHTRTGRVSYGRRFTNDVEMLISASRSRSDGDDRLYFAEFDTPSSNNGIAEDADDSDQSSLYAKLAYGDFTLSGAYSDYEKGVPTAFYDTVFNDARTRTWEGQAYLDLSYQTRLDSDADLSARLFYDRYWYDGDYVYDYAEVGDPEDLEVFKEEAEGYWWGAEAQLVRSWFDNHRTTVGVEYRNSPEEKQVVYDVYETYLDADNTDESWALYVQDEYRLTSSLIFNLGLRHDEFSNSGSSTNPRLAAIWTPVESTTLKFLYGAAFRAPNAYELYYKDELTQKRPADLDPETIKTYELVLERQLSSEITGVASIYHNNIEELITLTTDDNDDLLVFQNLSDATAEGIELELNAHYESGWNGSVSYTYQEAEDESGRRLVNSPRHMAKLNVIAPLAGDDFNAGIELQYQSGRATLAGDNTGDQFVTNLTVTSRSWLEGLTLSASLYNLFDEDYSVPGFEEHTQDQLDQDGRTFRIKLVYEL